MAKQQVDDDHQWWPRIKDRLGIFLVILALVLVGWILCSKASIEIVRKNLRVLVEPPLRGFENAHALSA